MAWKLVAQRLVPEAHYEFCNILRVHLYNPIPSCSIFIQISRTVTKTKISSFLTGINIYPLHQVIRTKHYASRNQL